MVTRGARATPLRAGLKSAPTGDQVGGGLAAVGPSAANSAWLIVRGRELIVQIQGDGAFELTDEALIAALLKAGLAAEKEGPHLSTAVAPAISYGKVRVRQHEPEAEAANLRSAHEAAVAVLRRVACQIRDD